MTPRRSIQRPRPGELHLQAMRLLVDALEKKKLVVRADVPGDRRSYRVRLTASGRRLHAVLGRLIRDVVGRALRGLPTKDREALRAGLRQVARNLRDK